MMQAYAEYKDSGVDWLGEVPKSWGTAKLKFIASLYNGDSLNESQKKSYESDDTAVGYAYISSKDITAETSSIDYKNGLRISKEHTKFKLAPKTASLICIEGGSAGRKIAFTRENVCFVNKLACVETKQCHDPKYTFHLLKSGPFQKQFYSAMTGLIGGVAISNIKNIELAVPPLPEQTAIAKIEALTVIKRQQIALLAERKQILIQNAVTKGLDPNARMKDSGVDWIGEIPEGWEATKLRYLGTFQNGVSAGAEYFGSGFPFVTYGDVYKNPVLRSKPSGLAKSSITDRMNYSIQKGDVLFTRTSEVANDIGVASTCLQTIKDVSFSGFVIRMRPAKEKLIPEFSSYLFRSSYVGAYFAHEMNIVIRASLGQELLKNLPIFLPSLDEQKEIVGYCTQESKKIDSAITIKQNQITKLNEYWVTLINAAVTGKIKVT